MKEEILLIEELRKNLINNARCPYGNPLTKFEFMKYADALQIGINALKQNNMNALLLGEELSEPKGAFRANKETAIRLAEMNDTDNKYKGKTIAYGDWCPYKSGDPNGLSEALLILSVSLILVVLQRGIPVKLEWIHESLRDEVCGPIRPEWVKNDEDYTIGWKARYPDKEAGG